MQYGTVAGNKPLKRARLVHHPYTYKTPWSKSPCILLNKITNCNKNKIGNEKSHTQF